ncbi:DUF4878 domain-containing protein [Draconibacterium orientale]|jgi:hypothetical protein|uniref:DUF4878 domain-containing protein n=1 Tax=Draconibacterium orientale TaxID=1168034 RepID=UPI0029C02D3B|nr:DUF4878 domain-containing protein [Draconibacterium orientale]
MKKILFAIIAIVTLCYCNSNQAEIERIHKEKIEVGKSLKITKLNNILKPLEENLSSQKQKLAKINEWQLGRTQTEKETQLAEQKQLISQIEFMKSRIENEIALSNMFQSFEFQNTPEGTIEQIFQAAKTEDYSKMRYLLDPYGEYDNDAFSICMIEMLPSESQKEMAEQFKNGRIMNNISTNDSTAIIEIAFGPSSNKLEQMHLVKRLNKWYISNF